MSQKMIDPILDLHIQEELKSNQQFLKIGDVPNAEDIADLVNSVYRGDSSKKGWTTEEALLDGQRTDAEGIREQITKDNEVF